jgi:hypothetical protein
MQTTVSVVRWNDGLNPDALKRCASKQASRTKGLLFCARVHSISI